MKVLLVIAHYFRPDPVGFYSSTRAGNEQRRQAALQQVLLGWRGHFQESVTLDFETRSNTEAPGAASQLDIVVAVHGDDHLLTPELQKLHHVSKGTMKPGNPRELPFGAHKIMAECASRYDWFVYSEDDLVVRDGLLLHKLRLFQERFGPRRVLQPNRYELNSRGRRGKTYIDGNMRDLAAHSIFALVEERQPVLSLGDEFGVVFERARNPHAGFFALTREQLVHWMRQKHFLDRDSSFISPLESGATLGLVKTFAVYKARPPLQAWFEIEHADDKFSNLRLPVQP